MDPLQAARLTDLMRMTAGNPAISVGLLDGPVSAHPDLEPSNIRWLRAPQREWSPAALAHGTFIAGILAAVRGSPAPSICPGSPLLVRTVFHHPPNGLVPATTPIEVAEGIIDCVDAGARILNLSLALSQPSTHAEPTLEKALSYAAGRGCLVVAAVGNQGALGSAAITRHSGVIPVAAFDLRGNPMASTNLAASVGRRGLGAPGERVTSLAPGGGYSLGGGTSAAAAFVTGAAALLWSLFPAMDAPGIRRALSHIRPRSVTPPRLNASHAYAFLAALGRVPNPGL